MIIMTERKLTYKSNIKDPKEAQVFFDMIGKAFSNIDHALAKLSIVFFDTRWCLKEGLTDSLSAYREAAEEIRNQLNIISMMNTTLTRFLNNETRPIPIRADTPNTIDRRTTAIKEELDDYYKKVKESKIPFPKFDDEIKRHRDIIVKINHNIDLINAINSEYPRLPIIGHVRNLSEI